MQSVRRLARPIVILISRSRRDEIAACPGDGSCFTLETDGRPPSGQPLGSAIPETDAATQAHPASYRINCAHPSHFESVLAEQEPWLGRLRGLWANASTKSHAELDAVIELDVGDPADLARRHAGLRKRLPGITILGGCCGTDHRHIAVICEACIEESSAKKLMRVALGDGRPFSTAAAAAPLKLLAPPTKSPPGGSRST